MYTCIVVYNENIYTTKFDIAERMYECTSKDWIIHSTSDGSYIYQAIFTNCCNIKKSFGYLSLCDSRKKSDCLPRQC